MSKLSNMLSPIWLMNTSHMLIEVYSLMHISLLPVFVKQFNLSLFEISLIVTGPRIFGLLTSLFSGPLIDRVKAKHLLILGMILQAIGGFFIAISWNIYSLFFGTILVNIASPIYHNCGMSVISRCVDGKELDKALGVHNALGSLGSALGLFLLPIFLLYSDWHLAYFIWVPFSLAWMVVLYQTKINSQKIIEGSNLSPNLIFNPNFVKFLIAICLSFAGSITLTTYITSYMVFERRLSEAISSLIFAIGPLLGILSSLFSGSLASILGEKIFLIMLLSLSSISIILLPLAPSILLLAILYVIFIFLNSAIWPPIHAITAGLTPLNVRGFAYSLTTSGYHFLFAITPSLIAKVIELTYIEIIFPISFGLTLASILLLTIIHTNPSKNNRM